MLSFSSQGYNWDGVMRFLETKSKFYSLDTLDRPLRPWFMLQQKLC